MASAYDSPADRGSAEPGAGGTAGVRRDRRAQRQIIHGFGRRHLWLRVRGRPVLSTPTGIADVGDDPSLMEPVGPHRNWLPRAAFGLPPQLFSRWLDRPPANLVDAIEEAVGRLATDGISVVRPLGSIAYARHGEDLNWDVVRDLDVWVYVSRATIDGDDWASLHSTLQRHVYDVLSERGVFTDISSRTGYVYLLDQTFKRRMIELKIADIAWLQSGLAASAGRNPTLIRPGRPAHATRPRIEWSGYVPHENHYASPAGAAPFAATIAPLRKAEVVFAQRNTYVENLAEAMRVLGPSRLRQAQLHEDRLRRYLHKVNKKQMMLGVLLRDDERRLRGLRRIEALRHEDLDWSERAVRTRLLCDVLDDFDSLLRVDMAAMRAWVEEEGQPAAGRLRWLDDQAAAPNRQRVPRQSVTADPASSSA